MRETEREIVFVCLVALLQRGCRGGGCVSLSTSEPNRWWGCFRHFIIYIRRFHVSLVFWLVDLKWCPRSVFWRVLALSERLAVRDVTKNIEY